MSSMMKTLIDIIHCGMRGAKWKIFPRHSHAHSTQNSHTNTHSRSLRQSRRALPFIFLCLLILLLSLLMNIGWVTIKTRGKLHFGKQEMKTKILIIYWISVSPLAENINRGCGWGWRWAEVPPENHFENVQNLFIDSPAFHGYVTNPSSSLTWGVGRTNKRQWSEKSSSENHIILYACFTANCRSARRKRWWPLSSVVSVI